jgi:hypothetical protein
MKRSGENLRDLWDILKLINIHIRGTPEREKESQELI